MKFSLKSNYQKFSKTFINFGRELTDSIIPDAVEKLLKQMCEDMIKDIKANIGEIREGSGLSNIDFTDIKPVYDKVNGTGTIYIGKNTTPLEMRDHNMVNPYLFIQFGYGIVGQENPVQYHTFNRWEYNINNHVKAWSYIGTDGEEYWTRGRKGTNFFYKIVAKYRQQWKDIVKQEIQEYYNTRR